MRNATLVLVLVLVVTAVACGDLKPLPTEPGGEGPADPAATFTRVQQDVFSASCALAGCHAGPAPRAGMDLAPGAAYAATVGIPSTQRPDLARIQAFDPGSSYIVKKLMGDPDIVGSPMPLSGGFTQEQFDLLEAWILRGAPND